MKVTQNVIHDLLPVYLAGEASADTAVLVEEFLRLDPDLARTVVAETLENGSSPPLVRDTALVLTKQKEG